MSFEQPDHGDELKDEDLPDLTPVQRVVCVVFFFVPFVASAVILLVRRYG